MGIARILCHENCMLQIFCEQKLMYLKIDLHLLQMLHINTCYTTMHNMNYKYKLVSFENPQYTCINKICGADIYIDIYLSNDWIYAWNTRSTATCMNK